MSTTAPVIALDHPAALDASRVGRKAAGLAAARAAGLPVGPGVVLTTDWVTHDRATATQVWRITSHDGLRPLVVRPSSTGRDGTRRPDAGALGHVCVAHDLDTLLAAIDALRADDPTLPVLLQPHVAGAWRGALFGDDHAPGWRTAPVLVARPAAGPGEWIAELEHNGRVRDVLTAEDVPGPSGDLLARVTRLATRVAGLLGGPHDLEWVVDAAGRIQLLRVRPVVRLSPVPPCRPLPTVASTAVLRGRRHGRSRLEPVSADRRPAA